ncbi:hypothetical protein EMCG_01566 [[Emmonsia] crescens]|uniref:Arabinan endo-1,5-alpha-L-arabinosidase n=1 Tax=[Emmonsia] crescens TaxID=73230 RepID=A0A0G2I1P6_9EURO|nr:hypothetical protein EMCG_01566 [Emmonsia crescens UAMH 3008]
MARLALILQLLILITWTHVYAAPGPCSGACHVRDPALIQRASDGKYFRFSTGNKIAIASASDLSGPWKALGSVVPGGSSINLPGRDDLWAPDVQKVGDVYHLYYSVSTLGSQLSAIGLATSEDMEPGSWTDHGSIGLDTDRTMPYNAIDSCLLQDGGTNYLIFGSYWKGIYLLQMNSNATAVSGNPHNIAYKPDKRNAIEGGYFFKHGHFYYIFYSDGICCDYEIELPPGGDEYKIKVCRSSSPTGKFVDKSGRDCASGGGSLVLGSHGTTYGPGGQGIFTDSELGPVLYYHYINTQVGYATENKIFGWNQIIWGNGWPTV